MCGITGGIWTEASREISRATLQRMTDAIAHRGPDAEGAYLSDLRVTAPQDAAPGIALGHRRLSIIDLATGSQPMCNEDGSVWIVFNGEAYNYVELRPALEAAGHVFKTDSDTETIIHLYEEYGPECFSRLNGMFALAIWDAKRRQIVLARDRLGKKPLVYAQQPGRLVFASELKSLLQVSGLATELDPAALDAYMTYQYIPHPRTIYRGIQKLPPGHYAVFRDERLSLHAYWQPDFAQETPIAAGEAVERIRSLLSSAVKMRMRSDVPLGAFLSGGVDSSIVVALMQQQSTQRVKTFTIGFEQQSFDEAPFAATVARHLGTEHQMLPVRPDAIEILPKLADHFDEPFADSSAIPTWYVSELTRRHVTVALSGDGGDELFAGYLRYPVAALADRFYRNRALHAVGAAAAWQWLPSSDKQSSWLRKLKWFSGGLRLPAAERYLGGLATFTSDRKRALYRPEFAATIKDDAADFVRQAWERSGKRDAITHASLADLVTYLPCDLMAKVDITSMAHGLECRAPLLDYRVVEFAASLPAALKHRSGRGKWLLQQAFGPMLPAEVFTRKKMGFSVPLATWFRNELKDFTSDLLFRSGAFCQQYFEPQAMQTLWEAHQQQRFDHSERLWSLVMLETWLGQAHSRMAAGVAS